MKRADPREPPVADRASPHEGRADPAPRRLPRSGGGPFLFLAVAAMGIGVAAWTPLPPGVWHDDGVYLTLGRALAEGEGLRYLGVPGSPAAPKFPPVYPAVAALGWLLGGDAGGATAVAVALNILFLAAAVGLAGAWARWGLGLPLRLALLVGGLAGLSVDLWRPAMVALSEPLYVLVMVGALWAAARAERPGAGWRDAALLVALLALLLHVRTAGAAVAGAAVLGLALRGRWRTGVGVGAALAVLALPWALWSAAAGAALPEPLRDILGPYGAWLGGAVMEAPLRYVAGLPGAGVGMGLRTLDLLVPPASAPFSWAAGAFIGVGVVAGIPLMTRRSPTAALALVLSLLMAWLWPYQDRRLLVPAVPLLLAALACSAAALVTAWGRRPRPGSRLAGVALAGMAAWALGFGTGSALRIARGAPTAAYEIRAAKLADALDAMEGRVPAGAVVGAPELWPTLPLLTGVRSAPSARFLPLSGAGALRAGSPEQQFRLWVAGGVDHLLLEQGGTIHGEALNVLEEACPGAVVILDTRPGLILVRLHWDEGCRRRVGAVP
ncbi:MAG: hypothetical protein KY453_02550 [Gemmatimonadetes bacterium]|nr:hypothetical protein [Gemmatimonadota bacterium]